jgi:hypothetical protein
LTLKALCRYADEHDNVTLYNVLGYESAGLWVDSAGYVCMPIYALFDDGELDMRMLYSSNLRRRSADVQHETEWVIRKADNPGLPTSATGKVNTDLRQA